MRRRFINIFAILFSYLFFLFPPGSILYYLRLPASVIIIFSLFSKSVTGFRQFQNFIPNGDRIPSPCNQSEIWPSIENEALNGSGLSEFAKAFVAANSTWTVKLCQDDSDGDGKTNGQELGDPNCVWKPGTTPEITNPSQLTHPGVCDPIDSPRCKAQLELCRRLKNASLGRDNFWCPSIKAPGVKTLKLRFLGETLKPFPITTETSYFCQTMNVPADRDYHIIAWEPLISNSEILAVNQIVLFICDTPDSDAELKRTGNYSQPSECSPVPVECQNSNILWSSGDSGGRRCFSDEAALAMGNNSYRSVILQIRYYYLLSPILITGANTLNDNNYTGLELYYTPTRRRYDVAQIRIGQRDIAIPPRSRSTTIVGRAFQTKACSLQRLAKNKAYSITALTFRMNKFGRRGRVSLEKASSGETITLFNDEKYSYNQSKTITWAPEEAATLEPGDNLVIECNYQTLGSDRWTFFGKNMDDEVCLAALDVYPLPMEANYLDLTSFGLNDRCKIDDQAKRQPSEQLCQPLALEKIINEIGNDTVDSLVKSCNRTLTSWSVDCCMFLGKHNFLSYGCVYSSAYQLVKRLLLAPGESMPVSVEIIHANIIKCITAVQTVTLEVMAVKTSGTSVPTILIKKYYYLCLSFFVISRSLF